MPTETQQLIYVTASALLIAPPRETLQPAAILQ